MFNLIFFLITEWLRYTRYFFFLLLIISNRVVFWVFENEKDGKHVASKCVKVVALRPLGLLFGHISLLPFFTGF